MKKYSLKDALLKNVNKKYILAEAVRAGGSAAQNQVALWCTLQLVKEMPTGTTIDYNKFFTRKGTALATDDYGGIQTARSSGTVADVEFKFPEGHPRHETTGDYIRIEVKMSNAYSYDVTCDDTDACPNFAKFDQMAQSIASEIGDDAGFTTGRGFWDYIHGGRSDSFSRLHPDIDKSKLDAKQTDQEYTENNVTYNYKKASGYPDNIPVRQGGIIFDLESDVLFDHFSSRNGLKLVALYKKPRERDSQIYATTSVKIYDASGSEIDNSNLSGSQRLSAKYLVIDSNKARPSSAAITTSGLTHVEYSTEGIDQKKAEAMLDAWNDHLKADRVDYLVIIDGDDMYVWAGRDNRVEWKPLEDLSQGKKIGPDSVDSMKWGSVAGQPGSIGQARVGIKFGKLKTGVKTPSSLNDIVSQAQSIGMPDEVIDEIINAKKSAAAQEAASTNDAAVALEAFKEVQEGSTVLLKPARFRIGLNIIANALNLLKGDLEAWKKINSGVDNPPISSNEQFLEKFGSRANTINTGYAASMEKTIKILATLVVKKEILDGADITKLLSIPVNGTVPSTQKTISVQRTGPAQWQFISKKKKDWTTNSKDSKTFKLSAERVMQIARAGICTSVIHAFPAGKRNPKNSEEAIALIRKVLGQDLAKSSAEPSAENSSRAEYNLPKLWEWAVK